MENTTILEKRIREKAKKAYDAEYKKLTDFLASNRISKKIYLNVLSFDEKSQLKDAIPLVGNGNDSAFFRQLNQVSSHNKYLFMSNYEDVEEELIEEYIKEETDNLLSKLEAVKYLFEQ